MAKIEKLTIDERIKLLQEVIDNLKSSTWLEFRVEHHCMDVPFTGKKKETVMTGEISIRISAYDPAKDKRRSVFGSLIRKR